MIEDLKKYIKENNIISFKEDFKSNINQHHRFLLAELAYREQQPEIFEFICEKTHITQSNRLEFLNKILTDGNKIKNFDILTEFSDMELHKVINAHIINFISKNNERT